MIIALLTTKYIVDVLDKKLDNVHEYTYAIMKITEKLSVEVREVVQNPGYVYTVCRWLRISREYVDGKGTHYIRRIQ